MDYFQALLSRKNRFLVFVSLACLFLLSWLCSGQQAQAEGGREPPLVFLESRQVEVSEEALLRLILAKAPTGLRAFTVSVSVRNGSIARISSAGKGEAIDGLLFQVLEQAGDVIEFRALSLFETRILPGDQDVILAEINVVGVKEGKTWMDVKVTTFIDDEGARLIRKFLSDGVEKVNCSLFIRTLLDLDPRGQK